LVALRCVDAVVLFAGTDCAAELTALAPDVYCKSAEYRGRQNRHEAAALAACGTRVVWHDREPGLSTSRIVAVSGGAVCAS
jgi:bifunctional ADP-heptose synthase (sugar kinase/adenylyltransferase)